MTTKFRQKAHALFVSTLPHSQANISRYTYKIFFLGINIFAHTSHTHTRTHTHTHTQNTQIPGLVT